MKRPLNPLVLWGLTLLAALLLGVAAGVGQRWLGPEVGAVIVAFAALLGFGVSVLKWRALDEAAREAHKTAWFWGACAALIPVAALFAWAVRVSHGVRLGAHVALPPGAETLIAAGVAIGVGVCVLLQLIGYALVWAGWWISKR